MGVLHLQQVGCVGEVERLDSESVGELPDEDVQLPPTPHEDR